MNFATAIRAGLTITGVLFAPLAPAADAAAAMVERGRYLVTIGGCNDCHTAGFALNNGRVPERQWLMGDELGWRGPWGTTYPTNLRSYFNSVSEDDWILRARNLTTRPPMPWFNVRAMSEQDLRALHRFVRALGPAGKAAPNYLPPGVEPRGPVITFPAPPK